MDGTKATHLFDIVMLGVAALLILYLFTRGMKG
jgi:hypothetical protein